MASHMRVTSLLEKAENYWPDCPAITFEDRTFYWRETAARCRGLAAALAALGVVSGDRVAYLGLNSHRYFESYYGPALIGASLVPINHRLSLREMIECVEESSPGVLIVDTMHVDIGREIVESCSCTKTIVYADDGTAPAGFVDYETSIRQAIYADMLPGQDDDTVLIFYTGGTTGRSKGVMLTHKNFMSNTLGTIPLYGMTEGETHLFVGPMFHVAGGSRVFTATALGAHTVIMRKFDVPEMLSNIEQYRVNMVQLVPTTMQMLLDHPEFSKFDLSSLRMITYGASPMSEALLKRVIITFPGIELCQSFGMTEASPVISTLGPEHHTLDKASSNRLKSVGRPVYHADIRIVGDNGEEMAAGESGEIVVRGPNIMKGYWQQPDLTARALKDGWYHTGDGGCFDKDGFLYLTDRIKDMIVSGGENVYPLEVENVLAHHPSVKQCAVIGIPHNVWGEAVHAVITLNDGYEVSDHEIIEFCRGQLAHYKCPLSVDIRETSLPLSGTNKILKSELRKPYWDK